MKKKIAALSLAVASVVYGAMEYHYQPGWNLFGTGEYIDAYSIQNPDIQVVWSYDNWSKKWQAYSPNPQLQDLINNRPDIDMLNEILPGQGFWIYATNEGTLRVGFNNGNENNETGDNNNTHSDMGCLTPEGFLQKLSQEGKHYVDWQVEDVPGVVGRGDDDPLFFEQNGEVYKVTEDENGTRSYMMYGTWSVESGLLIIHRVDGDTVYIARDIAREPQGEDEYLVYGLNASSCLEFNGVSFKLDATLQTRINSINDFLDVLGDRYRVDISAQQFIGKTFYVDFDIYDNDVQSEVEIVFNADNTAMASWQEEVNGTLQPFQAQINWEVENNILHMWKEGMFESYIYFVFETVDENGKHRLRGHDVEVQVDGDYRGVIDWMGIIEMREE